MGFILLQKKATLFFFLLVTMPYLHAQVGIGTTSPDASSVLDLTSTKQGLLAPRMTTAQRTAIIAPADGLMVFDTDFHALFYYSKNGTPGSWNQINNSLRVNYKLVKSPADLIPELQGGIYQMDSSTLYEINGLVTLANPIQLNNCSIVGQDLSMDGIVNTTTDIFTGGTSGYIRYLGFTAKNGNVFNLTGLGRTSSDLLRVTNCHFNNSNSIGTIANTGNVFIESCLFNGNATGITFTEIGQLRLQNTTWLGNNGGTYETFIGNIDSFLQSSSSFNVASNATAIDVSASPKIANSALIKESFFFGASTKYVKGYGTGASKGGLFSNDWEVQSSGIKDENDDEAKGTNYVDFGSYPGGAETTVRSDLKGIKMNVSSANLGLDSFRVSAGVVANPDTAIPNYLRYSGKYPRPFRISATFSASEPDQFTSTSRLYVFYFAKNGILIPGSESVVSLLTPFKGDDVDTSQSIVLNATTTLKPDEYVEVFVRIVVTPVAPDVLNPVLLQKGFNMTMD